MMDVLNLALPYFDLIFIGFACGKLRKLPEPGLAWMNFFLLHVSLPALFFRIVSRTPFEELNNLHFVVATTLATAMAFCLSVLVGRLIGPTIDPRSCHGGTGGRLRKHRLHGGPGSHWRSLEPRRRFLPR
jgi:predicted permease